MTIVIDHIQMSGNHIVVILLYNILIGVYIIHNLNNSTYTLLFIKLVSYLSHLYIHLELKQLVL